MSMRNYVKALSEVSTKMELEEIYNSLKPVTELASDDKYRLFIASPILSDAEKVEFLTTSLNISNKKVENLIKLLAENGKLKFLPVLVRELYEELCNETSNYRGVIYSNENLSSERVAIIEENLSKKVGKSISLTNEVVERDGIKVFVDVLDLEVSISNDDIKNKLIQDILKAI